MSDLIAHLTDRVKQYEEENNEIVPNISSSTLYEYFDDLRYSFGDKYSHKDAYDLAIEFNKKRSHVSTKFYRKFNEVLFYALYDFLVSNDYLERDNLIDSVAGIDNSLYFAIASFLNIDKDQLERDKEQLSGYFRVYRPSLSMKGKILVSCAQISSTDTGAMQYNEIMHYQYRKRLRRQVLEGSIVGKKSKYILLTTDSNTNLLQSSVLNAKYMNENKIEIMSGSYSGASNNIATGLFSTGIHFVREEFPEMGDTPFEDWEVGSIPKMGLVDRAEIEEEILEDMFIYPQD